MFIDDIAYLWRANVRLPTSSGRLICCEKTTLWRRTGSLSDCEWLCDNSSPTLNITSIGGIDSISFFWRILALEVISIYSALRFRLLSSSRLGHWFSSASLAFCSLTSPRKRANNLSALLQEFQFKLQVCTERIARQMYPLEIFGHTPECT